MYNMHEEETSWLVDQVVDRMRRAVDRPEDWDLTESCIGVLHNRLNYWSMGGRLHMEPVDRAIGYAMNFWQLVLVSEFYFDANFVSDLVSFNWLSPLAI